MSYRDMPRSRCTDRPRLDRPPWWWPIAAIITLALVMVDW